MLKHQTENKALALKALWVISDDRIRSLKNPNTAKQSMMSANNITNIIPFTRYLKRQCIDI